MSAALLRQALQADLSTTAATALLLGVLFHHSIRPIEIDFKLWTLFGISIALNLVLFGSLVSQAGFGVTAAVGKTALVNAAFNVGLFGSIAIYRLYFHRLHCFPGPWGAKLSRLWALRVAAKNVRFAFEVEKLHKQYGDFVRIGPREISINRASAIQAIYGPRSKLLKSTFYSQVSPDDRRCGLNATRNMDSHRRRRKAWDRAFSTKAMLDYEPRVTAKTSLFLSQIAAQKGQPLDITKWAMYYTFDVMGDVGLGKDFEMLTQETEHAAVKGLHDHMIAIGILATMPWLVNVLGTIPGVAGSYKAFFDYCSNQLREKQKTTSKDQDPRDIISWLLKAKYEGDGSAPPGDAAMGEDSRLLIVAGSDTTAAALANTFYFLAKNPPVLRKLQGYLDKLCPNGVRDWSYAKMKFPYLDHIINETLRLKPPVPSGLPRITPPEGIQIDEVYIPGDTIVAVPTHTIQRDERYYERPLDFDPERWERISPEKSAFIPFTRGTFACAGKNLALMELRMVLSRVALEYDVSFAPGENGVKFDTEVMDTYTVTLPPLHLCFTPRKE
ncbi:hypothetical protein VTN96DRAFT_5729 [Rasamsonia emersonii]